MQCKDIPDQVFLSAVDAYKAPWGTANSFAVADGLNIPWKLALAKASKLINRGLLDGCACGCRGDWKLERGNAHLEHFRESVTGGR